MKLNTSTILQLKEIQVEHFKLEENINGVNKFILDADFLPIEFTARDGKKQYRGISFILKVNHRTKNPALKAEIKIVAAFDVDKNLSEEEQVKFILYNGLSILYGIIRGMIFQACSILPPSMRLLPTVNIIDFIKSRLQKLKDEDELKK